VEFQAETVETISLGGNSFGKEACEFLSTLYKEKECPLLRKALFDNLFVSRLREEIPDSIRALTDALLGKSVQELDMSDNAFGPDGIKGWENFVRNCSKDLAILKINNCGISPLGGEMIASALKANENLALKHFEAGRDRLENDGITALASFFRKSGSLEVISVPQNGIKVEGMTALMESLATNKNLRELKINDNWLK